MPDRPILCSVQLLTCNNASSLPRCLESLTPFDEVIVQDGYSTDETREIAKKFSNVRILDQDKRYLDHEGKITNFGSMRTLSIQAAKHDWILVVDGDEGIQPEVAVEIREIIEKGVPGVYQMFRRFIVNGEPIMHSIGYPALQIRFFHRSLTDGYVKPIHERLALKKGVQVKMLRSELPVPLPPASSLRSKYEKYLTMDAKRAGVMPWGHWFKWIFYRNVRTLLVYAVRLCRIWLLPHRGKRLPLSYELQYMRYSLLMIVRTFPPFARRRVSRESM